MLWWVEREFNRKLLKTSDGSPLQKVSQRLARRLLADDNDAGTYDFRFPSGLYVEVALVGGDDKLLLLAKEATHGSHMAQMGRRWTCGIEEGVKLADAAGGTVDLKEVVKRGLREELEISDQQIADITFGAVVLQARHLNTAVLGVAKVRVPAEQLAQHAVECKFADFCSGKAITFSRAKVLTEAQSADNVDSWHATARFRLRLALAQRIL